VGDCEGVEGLRQESGHGGMRNSGVEKGANRFTGLIGSPFDMALFAHGRKLRGVDGDG
jgi:hypothetical protein